MPATLDPRLIELVGATDTALWEAYHSAIKGKCPAGGLIFPLKADGTIRVSEQEARQSLIAKLQNSAFPFSVETPTVGRYRFSSEGERSASTDLTLYGPNGARLLNFEFKAGNTSTAATNLSHITKDIQKLILEDVDGFWFHILNATDRGSVEKLWETIRQELKSVVRQTAPDLRAKQLTFHCCVLRQGFSVQTTFALDNLCRAEDWLMNVAPPCFRVGRQQLIDIGGAEGWFVNRHVPRLEIVTTETS